MMGYPIILMCESFRTEVTIVFFSKQAQLAGKEEHPTLVHRHRTLTTSPAGRAHGIVWCKDTTSKDKHVRSLYLLIIKKTKCNEKDWF